MKRSNAGSGYFGERGGALLIVLAIMMMLIIAALTAVDTAQTDIELSFNQLHYDQAFYVAEAGLQQALVQLNEENTWEDGYAEIDFGEGTYSVVVLHSNVDSLIVDTIEVRATGTIRDSHANLEALVVPRLWRPFQFAMFGDDSVTMINNTVTDSYNSDSGSFAATRADTAGDVGSNGEIDLTNTAIIGGDAASSLIAGVSVCATCTVRGDVASGVEPYVLDPLDDSEFDDAHDNNSAPAGMSGSFSYDAGTHSLTLATNAIVTLSSGVYYFSDMNLGSTSQLLIAPGASVKIYMTGDLILESNTSVNPTEPAEDLLIYSKGSLFTMGMNIDIHAAFYGPEADAIIGMACDFYGSLIAGSVSMDNSAQVHYDRALSDFAAGVTGEMVMVAWKEN